MSHHWINRIAGLFPVDEHVMVRRDTSFLLDS